MQEWGLVRKCLILHTIYDKVAVVLEGAQHDIIEKDQQRHYDYKRCACESILCQVHLGSALDTIPGTYYFLYTHFHNDTICIICHQFKAILQYNYTHQKF